MTIKFEGVDILPVDADLDSLQEQLGFNLPLIVREHFRRHNGGVPSPFILRLNDYVDTEVSCSLSVISNKGRMLVGDVYRAFVRDGRISVGLLPFAIDAGGDFFFVDCRSEGVNTYFYDTQARLEGPGLVDLERSFNDFWETLLDA